MNSTMRAALGPVPFAVVFLVGSTAQVAAQDEGGLNAQFDITQSIESIEERGFTGIDSSGARALTALDFGLRSVTRSQRLDFGFSSGIAVPFEGDRDVTADSIRSTLGYSRNSRNAELSFGALFRRDDVDDLVFDDTFEDDDVITGVGQREVLTVNSGLVVGREARITGTFNHTYETSDFFDTLDPELNDTETQAADGRLSFQLTRTLTLDVFGVWSDVDESGFGATDRITTEIGTGVSYRIDPITILAGEVSFRTEESSGATILDTEGWNYALSATRERPNGEVFATYTQEDALTGTRRQFIAGQDMDLQRGSLGYSLGVSETDGFDPQLLASLTLDYDMDRNGTARITLSQEGTINGDDEEVVNSRLGMSYLRALSPISGISASFDLVDENVLATGAADQRTYRFDVSYEYELTRDWGLTSGYAYSVVQLDGTDDRSRSTVFVGLQRSFNYRP
ncbi:MAG: hypothetical protein NWQ23_11805 [Yoonia sp.]|uniref:hypothetical protein n=1 Tax=Yoonia sp. TaxID=2212373 RepID=UPI00273F32A5|nr:hypothetical protein [Yoonia sp.]MDP5086097.1 hypothetical protein [Yoonia sp.]